eukprot:TRINITY_DN1143_c1_g1_i12.p1 TRINITY_DN1143_c1_g1~~TRINITY_DN1143_c1_g1_i12.p1  ORF type:complete len:119 (-),score=8.67 TRINITY_DN1143_c1_g1_i12:390-746(-)
MRSLGASWGLLNKKVSDCVLIVRPTNVRDSLKLLFSLRVSLRSKLLRQLLERGTGAIYVTASSLEAFEIPYGLDMAFPNESKRYRRAASARNRVRMLEIELEVAELVFANYGEAQHLE